jgi:hypothetical protein
MVPHVRIGCSHHDGGEGGGGFAAISLAMKMGQSGGGGGQMHRVSITKYLHIIVICK